MAPPDRAGPMSGAERAWRRALTVVLALYTVWSLRSPDQYHFLDAIDLPIHETGHLVFAWGGDILTALGGTLLQLIMPLAFAVYFWRRGDRHAASVPLWWTGQNCWNIARYVADARAMELPLVGGGEHDWNYLLSEWGVLGRDTLIARDIRFLGTVLAIAAIWIGWQALKTPDAEAAQSPAASAAP
jgi:hypothetical protein